MESRVNFFRCVLIVCVLVLFQALSSLSFAASAKTKIKPKALVGSRTFTFVNNCSYPVWIGMSGGSTSSIGGKPCASNSDCYAGSSCVGSGSNAHCFWNNPVPSSGNYQVAANGGSNQVSIPMYSGGDGSVWSGVITGRTGCTSSGCQTGDCGNGVLGCKPAQGFSQPATQAEMTLALGGVDYYDVEVINGFSIPVAMSPNVTASQLNPQAPYSCGSPGSANPLSTLLGACSWKFTPPANDYNWVQNGGKACSLNSDCQASSVCGLSINPGQSPLLQKTCGPLLGYWTANEVCGIQSDYGAPFNCQQPLPAPPNETLGQLYGCGNVGSCYQNQPSTDCCGCVNWDQLGIKVPSAPYTQQCGNQNPSWITYVEPTLNWLKSACPTAYTYPFDDMSSTFTCGVLQNNLNTVNYTITYCPNNAVPPPPPPPAQEYAYTVYTGYPFSPVLINNSITCPDPTTHNPACLVGKQASGSTMLITGSNSHVCKLAVQTNGSIVVNSGQSNGCNINSTAATPSNAGAIELPSNF